MPVRKEVHHRPYRVTLYDRAGENDWKEFAKWKDALATWRQWRLRHPGLAVELVNLDHVDLNHDGLTETEREELEGG